MSLDLSAVGYETEPFSFEYDWKTTVLYALGVGAKRDELDYLYEGRGPKVLPSFADDASGTLSSPTPAARTMERRETGKRSAPAHARKQREIKALMQD